MRTLLIIILVTFFTTIPFDTTNSISTNDKIPYVHICSDSNDLELTNFL